LHIATVPIGVYCLQVSVQGVRSVTVNFDVTPAHSANLTLSNLPAGIDVLSAAAFNASCGAVTADRAATWTGGPTTVSIASGVTTPVSLKMRRPGDAAVSV